MAQAYSVLLPLALIFLVSRTLCSVCKRLHIPFVVGELVAGLLVGLIRFIPGQTIITDFTTEGLSFFAKIGVVLIMFSAGLNTDVKMVRSTGRAAVIVTLFGVAVPIAFGFLTASLFLHHGLSGLTTNDVLKYLFYGVILTATSVSVTVATLKEMGKLSGKVGTTIVTAAILDDIVGIILLSLASGVSGEGAEVGFVILKMVLFFAVAIPLGFLLRFLFKKLVEKGLPDDFLAIAALAVGFIYAYCAQELCGVADITGAFFAGLMLSGTQEARKTEQLIGGLSLFFLPVFFANIGITTQFTAIDSSIVLFGVAYVFAALLSKAIGCGAGAMICRFHKKESLAVGVGMMVRAEVLLICAEKGIRAGMVDPNIMPFILAIILVSSLVTPVILKLAVGDRHHAGPAPVLRSDPAPQVVTEGTPISPAAQQEASQGTVQEMQSASAQDALRETAAEERGEDGEE